MDVSESPRVMSRNTGLIEGKETPSGSKSISPVEWERHKDIIRDLYIRRDMFLADLVSRMRTEHGFRATSRMYKSRLRAWGFQKNVRHTDWQAAAILLERRTEAGKPTVAFKINNRTKTVNELKRYIKASGMSNEKFVAQALCGGQSSASVRCISPKLECNSELRETGSSSMSSWSKPTTTEFSSGSSWNIVKASTSSGKSVPSVLKPTLARSTPRPPRVSESRAARGDHDVEQHSMTKPLWAAEMPDLMPDPLRTANTELSSCDHVQQELGFMMVQTWATEALTAYPSMGDVGSWSLMTRDDCLAEPMLCPRCSQSTRSHSPLPQNWHVEPSAELPQMLSYQITSTGHIEPHGSNEASKFSILCFAACMYGGSERYDFMSKSLHQADQVFESMLLTDNDMSLLSVLLTLIILHTHDRGSMAESIIRSALLVSSRLLGDNNPFSLCLQWLTAAAGSKLSRCTIKSTTLGRIHLQMEKTFGMAHQHTIVALYCLGFQLIREKSYVEAEHHFTRLCEICVITLGEESLQTVSSLNGLGKSQQRQGKLVQAIETLEKSLDKHPLGPNHPFRLDSMKELAKVYKKLGRKDLMEDIYWYVLKGRIKILGKLHSFTVEANIDLERLLRELGKWDAEGMMEEKVQKLFRKGASSSDAAGFSSF